MTKITRYRQSLYHDWKDGEITQQEYRDMKADYERQAAGLPSTLKSVLYTTKSSPCEKYKTGAAVRFSGSFVSV